MWFTTAPCWNIDDFYCGICIPPCSRLLHHQLGLGFHSLSHLQIFSNPSSCTLTDSQFTESKPPKSQVTSIKHETRQRVSMCQVQTCNRTCLRVLGFTIFSIFGSFMCCYYGRKCCPCRAGASFLVPVMNWESVVQGLLVAVVVGLIITKLRAPKLKLPSGPVALPVVGNWLQVEDDLNHRNLAEMFEKYGDVFMLKMGQRNLVVVSSPDIAKDVLHTQGVEFGSRMWNVVFDIFTGKGQDLVFIVYGEHWRRMRRIMTLSFFTNKVVQQSRGAWKDEAQRVIDNLKAKPKAGTTGVVIRKGL